MWGSSRFVCFVGLLNVPMHVFPFSGALSSPRVTLGRSIRKEHLARLLMSLNLAVGRRPRLLLRPSRTRGLSTDKRWRHTGKNIMAVDGNGGLPASIAFSDGEEMCRVSFPLKANLGGKDIVYKLENNRLTLGVGSELLISDAELQGSVFHEECDWMIEDVDGIRFFVLDIAKKEEGAWTQLLKDGQEKLNIENFSDANGNLSDTALELLQRVKEPLERESLEAAWKRNSPTGLEEILEECKAIESAAGRATTDAVILPHDDRRINWTWSGGIRTEFDYENMENDSARSKSYETAIQRRLKDKTDWIVLDIGTGPSCFLALMAARAGARRVYAVEANHSVAERARRSLEQAELAGTVTRGVVQVIEGFSTAVTLPEKADLLITETFGDVASWEGFVNAVLDAQSRHLKSPYNPESYIPQRVQTPCAPVSFFYASLKSLASWEKVDYDSVHSVEPDNPAVHLLSDPQLLEDFEMHEPFESYVYNNDDFQDDLTASDSNDSDSDDDDEVVRRYTSKLQFAMDEDWINHGRSEYLKILNNQDYVKRYLRLTSQQQMALATNMSRSCAGLACWFRATLDTETNLVIDTVGNKSTCWNVALALFDPQPLSVEANDWLNLTYELGLGTWIEMSLQGSLSRASSYI